MIQRADTCIPGLFVLSNQVFNDKRGGFRKLLSKDDFNALRLECDFAEMFYSTNNKNVIRGMHFQIPPKDHVKMVYVISGRILDVCLDLRSASKTYGQCFSIELSESGDKYLYIPKGIAHGFASLEDNSIVHYAQTSCYSPECDRGIRFDSFNFDWKIKEPVVSERDMLHPAFSEWRSVF